MQVTALANPSSTPSGEIGSSLSSIPLSLHSKYIIWQIGQDPIKYLTNQYEGFSVNANGAVDTQSDVVAVSPPLAIIGANIPRLISANIKYVKMGPDSDSAFADEPVTFSHIQRLMDLIERRWA